MALYNSSDGGGCIPYVLLGLAGSKRKVERQCRVGGSVGSRGESGREEGGARTVRVVGGWAGCGDTAGGSGRRRRVE